MTIFYDTCALLNLGDQICKEPFVISSKSLEELESIKRSATKDDETKSAAWLVSKLLDQHPGLFCVIPETLDLREALAARGLPYSPDNIILETCASLPDTKFISDDTVCRLVGREVFSLVAEASAGRSGLYPGFMDLSLSDEELAEFYSHKEQNPFGCLINQYVLIRNNSGMILDAYRWDGHMFLDLVCQPFRSHELGIIRPLDIYQRMAFDSIISNDITVLHGGAGSGKTQIALAYLMQFAESHTEGRCYIVYHYETLKRQRTLGYEKGDHLDKLLNSASLGNLLATKFGDLSRVANLIKTGTITVIPTANIRGVEFGEHDLLYVTESQDIDTYALKTLIQRCKAGCKQIYEGDIAEQVDINRAAGLPKMIDLYKGRTGFGCVKLMQSYRGDLCALADQLC